MADSQAVGGADAQEAKAPSVEQVQAEWFENEITLRNYLDFEAELNRLTGRVSLAVSQLQTNKVKLQESINAFSVAKEKK